VFLTPRCLSFGGSSASQGRRSNAVADADAPGLSSVADADNQDEVEEDVASQTRQRDADAGRPSPTAASSSKKGALRMMTSFNFDDGQEPPGGEKSSLSSSFHNKPEASKASATTSRRSASYEVSEASLGSPSRGRASIVSSRPRFPFGAWSCSTASQHWSDAALDPTGFTRCTKGIMPNPEKDLPRQRIFDHSTSYQRPPSPGSLSKTVNRQAKFSLSSFGLKPAALAIGKMRPTLVKSWEGVKVFPNAPLMQSDVDRVVFGRDMDFSGDSQWDQEFTVMYDGSCGYPSWVKPPPRTRRKYPDAPMQQSTVDQFTQLFDGSAGLPSCTPDPRAE